MKEARDRRKNAKHRSSKFDPMKSLGSTDVRSLTLNRKQMETLPNKALNQLTKDVYSNVKVRNKYAEKLEKEGKDFQTPKMIKGHTKSRVYLDTAKKTLPDKNYIEKRI